MTKITKILIANRGEIACRIMKTAKKMGIASVAVYSDADKNALHVKMADEAVHIGPSPAAQSYLLIDKIIEACQKTGADAVHPGYGFLSENPTFARALAKHGIIFIGPSPQSMEAMGLKDAAKKLMAKSGVPITPGYHGDDQDTDHLQAEADKIGYPVLIKAVAGGGGKGMRKVDSADGFKAALASAQREAASAFGQDKVLIEKYITAPRHIEVQVFGDTHGNVIHLFERDCSLQRRHQKVIEEAPAPNMPKPVRAAMTKAAINAARAVQYEGAGTVEFIVDGSGELQTDGFWFMEMNTRLQVEHPVTEMITGLDLVELQIRVAQGEKLPPQDAVTMTGHAVEARIYAEDPDNDFVPSIGKLDVFSLPHNTDLPDGCSLRIDTGVEEKSDISIYYDPMIAKLTAHGPNRKTAILALKTLCHDTHIWPVKSNTAFLYQCLGHTDFIDANISTHFIPTHADILFAAPDMKEIAPLLAPPLQPEHSKAWRLNLDPATSFVRYVNGEACTLAFTTKAATTTNVYDSHDGTIIFTAARAFHITDRPPANAQSGSGGDAIAAPMPGNILSVAAQIGDTVTAGQTLITMEAMKMEMNLPAPRDGIVAAVLCQDADIVSDGQILIQLETETK